PHEGAESPRNLNQMSPASMLTDFRKVLPRARETAAFRDAILAKLTYGLGKDRPSAQLRDWYAATVYALRDRIIDQWMATTRRVYAEKRKRVYFLSVEFLIGRLLYDTLCNLSAVATTREALAELGINLDEVRDMEPDAALGNGGLGRLAACFMDSLATLGIPAFGYGLPPAHARFPQHTSPGLA